MKTTNELFLNKATPIRLSEEDMSDLFSECFLTIRQLNEVKRYMVPENIFLYSNKDNANVPDVEDFESLQLDVLETYLSDAALTATTHNIAKVFVSSKPVANMRFKIFMWYYEQLVELMRKVTNRYIITENDLSSLSSLCSSCLYNLGVFTSIQYNMEEHIFGWKPNDYGISVLVKEYSELYNIDLDSIYALISDAYKENNLALQELRRRFGAKLTELENKVQYAIFDLEDVPEVLDEAKIDAVLTGKLTVDDFEEAVYQAIVEKYNLD